MIEDPVLSSSVRIFGGEAASYYLLCDLHEYRLEVRVFEIFQQWNADGSPILTAEGNPFLVGGDFGSEPVATVEEADEFLHGSVKWDGCSNWDFNTDSVMMHFCSRQQAVELGELLGAIYDLAKDTVPSWSL